MSKLGHRMEQAEIRIALGLLFDSSTDWFKHSELVEWCNSLCSTVHPDCVRRVVQEMCKHGEAEFAVKDGNYVYRCNTAMGSQKAVFHARKRHR